MNGAFWAGFFIAVVNEVIKFRHKLFYKYEDHVVSWSIIVGAPTLFSVAFLAGVLVEHQSGQKIYLSEVLVPICSLVIAVCGEHAIERGSSVVREVARLDCGGASHRKRVVVVYATMLAAALFPYVAFAHVHYKGHWLWPFCIAVVILLLVCLFGNRLFGAYIERQKASARIATRSLLDTAFRCRMALDGSDGHYEGLLQKPVEDLEILQKLTQLDLTAANHFQSTMEGKHGYFAEFVLSERLLEEIMGSVHVHVLKELNLRIALIKALIGTDAEREDAVHTITTLAGKPNPPEIATVAYRLLPRIALRRDELRSVGHHT